MEIRGYTQGKRNSVHSGHFPSDKKAELSTLIYFLTHIYLRPKLSGLAKEEEIDVQLTILPRGRLTGTLSM